MQSFSKESVDNQKKIMTSGAYIRQHNYTSVDVPECNMLKRWQRTRQMVITYENTGSRVPIVENRSQSLKKHPRVVDIDAGVHRSFAIGDRKIIELK
jgi:hypothetical protein